MGPTYPANFVILAFTGAEISRGRAESVPPDGFSVKKSDGNEG